VLRGVVGVGVSVGVEQVLRLVWGLWTVWGVYMLRQG